MIYSIKHKYFWVSVPRTGTSSMMSFLIENYTGNRHGMWHQLQIPKQYAHYHRFMVVRNPFTRLASWWRWCVYGKKHPYGVAFKDTSLLYFLQWLVDHQHDCDTRNLKYWCNQTEFAEEYKPNTVLKLENIKEDLLKLPFVSKPVPVFKQHHKTYGQQPWLQYYGPKEIALVLRHSGVDFDTFGYDRSF